MALFKISALTLCCLAIAGCSSVSMRSGPLDQRAPSSTSEDVLLEPDMTSTIMSFVSELGTGTLGGSFFVSESDPQQTPGQYIHRFRFEVECFRNPYTTNFECYARPDIGFTLTRLPLTAAEVKKNPRYLLPPHRLTLAENGEDKFVLLLKEKFGAGKGIIAAKGYSINMTCVRKFKEGSGATIAQACLMREKAPLWDWDALEPLIQQN